MYAKVVSLQIFVYFGSMKNYKIGFLLLGLVAFTASVSFASTVTVVDNDSKKDFLVTEAMPTFESVIINYEGYDFGVNAVAVMPSAILIPGGTIEFLKNVKPFYMSPDIDRKWVWWYSVVTNS